MILLSFITKTKPKNKYLLTNPRQKSGIKNIIMSNKRDYPLFLIDRSKLTSFPFDMVTCFDKTVGFVAKVIHMPTDVMYNEFLTQQKNVASGEVLFDSVKTKKGGIIILIIDFLYYFEWTKENQTRVKTLLKKGFKKFMHTEYDNTPSGDLTLDNQIIQQELSIQNARANYEALVARANGDREIADYQIALAEATLQTLKSFRDNQKFFALNMN